MTCRPIIFSAAMVRAILDGRKTMTRRVLKPKRGVTVSDTVPTGRSIGIASVLEVPREKLAVPFAVGDRLWVREAWRVRVNYDRTKPADLPQTATVIYEADPQVDGLDTGKLRPTIHMPRWASRITLEVTGVRVERLQEISEEDAKAEGIFEFTGGLGIYGYDKKGTPALHACDTARDTFAALWGSIHGPGAWEANPWVCAVTFRRVDQTAEKPQAETVK